MDLLTRLRKCFTYNEDIYDSSFDFIVETEKRIICTGCDSVSSNQEFSTSIGLTVSGGDVLRFKVIKLCRDYSIYNTYCEEYEVECEMDATVEQIKQNLEL